MKLTYWLRELRNAFLRNDYDRQTEVAIRLLPYEESGEVTNEVIMELFK